MNRLESKIIFFGIILLFFPIVFSTHCWELKNFQDYDPKLTWTANTHVPLSSSMQYNGFNVTDLVIGNSTAKFSDFGKFNILCNNGAKAIANTFAKLEIKDLGNNSNKPILYNTLNNTCAVAFQNMPYCKIGSNGKLADDPTYPLVGKGTNSSISQLFDSSSTPLSYYSIIGSVDEKPVTNKCNSGAMKEKKSQRVLYIPNTPSVLVFPPAKKTISFFDNDGIYSETIFYTITKNHPLKIKILDLDISCDNNFGIDCKIQDEANLQNFVLDEWEDMLVVSVELTFDKTSFKNQKMNENILTNLQLNVKFNLPELEGLAENLTSSQPKQISFSLIDQQDFQIMVQGKEDRLNECVSSSGLIGVTGEDYSPRINLSFGKKDNGKINADSCDLKKINGEANDWVYCSQNEVLVELAQKIGEIIKIKNAINAELNQGNDINQSKLNNLNTDLTKHAKSKIFVRDLDLSKEKIEEHLNNLNIELFSQIGLSGFTSGSVNFGDTVIEQKNRLKKLFAESEVITFKAHSGLMSERLILVGMYDLEINVVEVGLGNNLFDINGTINEEYSIEINFSNRVNPNIDWFFYRNEMSEITSEMINSISSTLPETNYINRGVVLKFSKELNSADIKKIDLIKMFAVPLFVKIEKKEDKITNNFYLDGVGNILEQYNVFSYWTGFASNQGDGCGEISTEKEKNPALVYGLPDMIKKVELGSPTLISLEEFNNINSNEIEFLQTVIYAPLGDNDIAEEFVINGDISLYGTNFTNHCNFTNNNCELTLNRNTSNFFVDGLEHIFDGIKENKICIHEDFAGTINKEWTLFWNETELLRALDSAKEKIISETEGVEQCNS